MKTRSLNERSKGEEDERKGRGRERKRKGKGGGGGKLEVKLWQKRKKSQTPQPGIEPGTPANAADALPVCWGPGFDSRLGRLRFFPFLPKLHFQFPFPLSLPLSFSSSSFPFIFLSLRPFRLRFKISLFAFIPLNKELGARSARSTSTVLQVE